MLGVISRSATYYPLLNPTWYSGSVRVVVAVGPLGGWRLLERNCLAEQALAAQRSKKLRVFRKLNSLVLYLQESGVIRI